MHHSGDSKTQLKMWEPEAGVPRLPGIQLSWKPLGIGNKGLGGPLACDEVLVLGAPILLDIQMLQGCGEWGKE